MIGNRGINEIGNRYGRLTVIREDKPRNRLLTWLCRCDCGGEKIVRGTDLRGGSTRSCGCLYTQTRQESGSVSFLPKGQASFNHLYGTYKRSAKKKGVEWALSKEEMRRITSGTCHYCGSPPSQIIRNSATNHPYTYSGLDRLDCSKGYTPHNVRPCCKYCNYAKNDRTEEEFRSWVYRIGNHMFRWEELLEEALMICKACSDPMCRPHRLGNAVRRVHESRGES